ncbi:RNA polymerase recycling motor HelD [Lysinibacillus piscis]|uniref:DNA helicase n=1 Tax=Lysinibacillus piscis TaxID=2518931 RepID=A0ABQ5NNS2_9BACI|nr:RNA polymerase recycling motor HelD [Lysinibacillus sp. KH24]GLC90027.1 DNA helicase [Lysinibacillus sp. KH24]
MTKHADEIQERNYLVLCLQAIGEQREEAVQREQSLQNNVISLKETFWDDVRINFDTFSDIEETYLTMKQQAELLSGSEVVQQHIVKSIQVYDRLQQSPYFARIDFLPQNQQEPLQVYIGVANLFDEKQDDILIYDWRAPIASMYYDHTPGPAHYETPTEQIQGDMLLKRQFIIKNGQLQAMFNTGLTIGDDLLRNILAQNADEHIRSIVATIQAEQNKIIRHVQTPHLIVEGVAGSGKTAVALQRIAYLLYHYRNQITADQIVLITPNQLFNQYVNAVLPDLGEDNMQQLTFSDYANQRLGRQFQLEYPYEQLESLLSEKDDTRYQTKLHAITFKASHAYRQLLDQYLGYLSKQGLLFKNIVFRGERIITAQEITKYFYSLDTAISIPNRLQFVKEWLLQCLTAIEKAERHKEWVEEESDLLETEEYTKTYSELLQEGRFAEDTFDDFEQERRTLAKQIVQKQFMPLRRSVTQLKFVHLLGIYRQFFTHQHAGSLPPQWEEICHYTQNNLTKRLIAYEDIAPLIYLQDKIEGQRTNTTIRHVLVDEAQDYSPFQLYVLQQLFPYARMTILGDGHQTIHPHTFHNPSLLAPELYGEQVAKMVLTRSYRSTKQIIHFTSKILKTEATIEAFNRNGTEPTITVVTNEDDLITQQVERVNSLTSQFDTIAIICKTAEECQRAYDKLHPYLEVQLVTSTTKQLKKGILLLPVYMAKGLEFDAVLLFNASNTTYSRETERNYFYTACTRAMHKLHIYAIDTLTHLIPQ